MDRRTFVALSTTALASTAGEYLLSRTTQPNLSDTRDSNARDHFLIEQVQRNIQAVRDLDDAEGGAAHLAYADAQFKALALLLRDQSTAAAIDRKLQCALAELAQQVGWMAYDAGRHGLAQRYYLTGLRLTRDAGDDALASHILADLGHQATALGEPAAAVQLANAALEAVRHATAGVQASVMIRVAYAHAAAGLIPEFERGWSSAREMLERRRMDEDPPWMYYMTPGHVDAQAGSALIHLGRHRQLEHGRSSSAQLVQKGVRLLREVGFHDRPLNHPHQRRALFEGSWLAVGHAAEGDAAAACAVGRVALQRLERVRSPRSVDLLQLLAHDLAARARERHILEFLPDLKTTLSQQAVQG